MNRTLLTTLTTLLPMCMPALTIEKATPGHLADAIGGNTDATTLIVTGGELNAADFAFLADKMSRLESIDLSGCGIAAYSGPAISLTKIKKAAPDCLPPYAFLGMQHLRSVKLPADITAIGTGAFSGTPVTGITLPETVDSIADYAFMRCTDLETITLPASLRTMGRQAFANCRALRTVRFTTGGTGLESLPERAFEGCVSLNDINLYALTQCTEIGPWSLSHCHGLTALILPESVTTINQGAMIADDSIDNFNLPASTTRVGNHAMAGMSAVSTTTLPATLLHIGSGAMAGWDALTEINARALSHVPELDHDVWLNVNTADVTLEVGHGMTELFANSEQWCDFNIHEDKETGLDASDAVPEESAMTVHATTGKLMVSAVDGQRPLGTVAVFSASGIRMAYHGNAPSQLTFPTSGWAKGVYLIVSNLGVAKTAI